jgi:phospholipase/carboxylesterase
MADELNGPRLAPRSGTAQQLVVFLHGYGADGNDLIEIGRAWQEFLPRAAFVSPHAPEPCGQAPVGRQWFALTFRDPNERWVGVNKAAPGLQRFLDAELARHKLPPSALALVGFSQGTMMALHVGLRRSSPPAAIVGYSGLLVLPPDLNAESFAAEIKSRPPILLVHGDRDDLIPAQALFQAAQGLAALDIPAEWHLSAGIGHGIDGEGLRHGGEFLAHRHCERSEAIQSGGGRSWIASSLALLAMTSPQNIEKSIGLCRSSVRRIGGSGYFRPVAQLNKSACSLFLTRPSARLCL